MFFEKESKFLSVGGIRKYRTLLLSENMFNLLNISVAIPDSELKKRLVNMQATALENYYGN